MLLLWLTGTVEAMETVLCAVLWFFYILSFLLLFLFLWLHLSILLADICGGVTSTIEVTIAAFRVSVIVV